MKCLTFLLVLALGVSRETRAADDSFALRSLLPLGAEQTALRRAVMRARQRLARPGCQQMFSEFKDASGRTLQENLDALEQTPAGYLGLILFADGAGLRRCKASTTLFAMTDQGSRVVYTCGRQFAFVNGNNATQTEAFIIHEELHSLGLGENPPSSKEITARVLASCAS